MFMVCVCLTRLYNPNLVSLNLKVPEICSISILLDFEAKGRFLHARSINKRSYSQKPIKIAVIAAPSNWNHVYISSIL